MKYLIMSDIHGNLEALQAVLAEVRSVKIDRFVILGDVVAQGANPNEVVDLVREMNPTIAIRGNRDKAVAGISSGHESDYAIHWTRGELSPGNRDYIAHLSQGPVEVDELFGIVHGAPWDEEGDITQPWHVQQTFEQSNRQITFFGHTHVPIVWVFDSGRIIRKTIHEEYYEYTVEENKRYLINPGSVGLPRDGSAEAAMVIFDSDQMKMQFSRVRYNSESAMVKIRKSGSDGRPPVVKRVGHNSTVGMTGGARYLILGDIHGNVEALDSVLSKAKTMDIDRYVILGDLVGYGASPNEVVNLVKEMESIATVRGNHDKVVAGLSDGSDFNIIALNAAIWNREKLSQENRDYVADLPRGPIEVDGLFYILHGAPWDEDEYISEWSHAKDVFLGEHEQIMFRQLTFRQITFFGHTHMPIIWRLEDGSWIVHSEITDECKYSLNKDARYLINPGSVGQPRDNNPKASMAVLDTGEMKIQFLRVEYNVKGAQAKIRQAGLAEQLADRLSHGV